MNLPDSRDPSGPAQIRQLQQDIDQLKECIRAMKLTSTETVRVNETSVGTTLEIKPGQQSGSDSLATWQ